MSYRPFLLYLIFEVLIMAIIDTQSPKKLKLSPFVHFFKKNEKIAVYNSLNHNVFYGDKQLLTFLKRFEK